MWALDLKKEIDDMLDEHGKSIEPDNDKPKPEQPKDIVKAVHTPIIHKALQQHSMGL